MTGRPEPRPEHPDRLEQAVRGLVARPRAADDRELAARVTALERDVQEVRTRVNALFFTVIAVAIAEFVTRLVAG